MLTDILLLIAGVGLIIQVVRYERLEKRIRKLEWLMLLRDSQ